MDTVGLGVRDENRVGDWCQVWPGIRFWPLDPRPEEVQIETIAHALARICRFGGHCSEFYSVASHSLLVMHLAAADNCDQRLQLDCLLHDAAEAYVGDLVRPLKRRSELSDYCDIEHEVQNAVALRFELMRPAPIEVRHYDNMALNIERRDLMGDPQDWQGLPPMTAGFRAVCRSPEEDERLFLEAFERLGGK